MLCKNEPEIIQVFLSLSSSTKEDIIIKHLI